MEKIQKWRTDLIYFFMLIFFGILLAFLTPPYQVPDEPNHFYRAYQISEGIFRSPSVETSDINGEKIYYCAEIPNSQNSLYAAGIAPHGIIDGRNYFSLGSALELFSVPLNSEDTQQIHIPNTGSYSPLVYAPQATGIFLARLLSDSIGAVFYGARLGAVIFAAICGFFALRFLPEKKFLIFAITFAPMFLFEAASCSADSTVYALTLLCTAYLLSLRKKNTILAQDLFFMGLASISLGFSKQVYGTVLLLYFLIPEKNFGGRRNFLLAGLSIFMLYLTAAASWIHFAKSGVNVLPYMAPFPNVNLSEQINFVKDNPLEFLKACSTTTKTYLLSWGKSFIGNLGWLNIQFPKWFYYFYTAIFLVGGFWGSLNLKIFQRALMIFAVIPTFLATFLFLYLTWTPVGDKMILGFQGRYLIPCALMFFSAFSFKESNSYENIFSCALGIFSATFTIWVIVQHFY